LARAPPEDPRAGDAAGFGFETARLVFGARAAPTAFAARLAAPARFLAWPVLALPPLEGRRATAVFDRFAAVRFFERPDFGRAARFVVVRPLARRPAERRGDFDFAIGMGPFAA
jgi:hypothetical protein